MNVSKIQDLSMRHKLLKSFHKACNNNDVRLISQTPPYTYGDVELDCGTTRLIISDVRVSLLKRISELEKDIKKEATDG